MRKNRTLLVPIVLVALLGVMGLRAATAATATYAIVPGGPPLTIGIDVAGDTAEAVFDGAAGQRVALKLSSVTIGTSTCCSARVSIVKPDGTMLVAPTFFGTTGAFVDAPTLPLAGSYRIVVDPEGTATGGATLTLYDVPADVTAPIVPGGASVTVTTTTPGQNATLTFDGAAGQRVSLKVGPVCCSTRASIRKPDGTNLVAPTTLGATGGFVDVKTLPVAGTYTILVDPQSSATGSMTVTLYDVPPDVAAAIVPGGAAVTVSTTSPGQNAKLTFTGTAGQRVSLKAGPVCCSTRVSILKPDGTTLVSPTAFGTTGGFIDAKALPVAGVYTILVDPQSSAIGSMTLTLYDVPVDVTGAIAAGSPRTVTMTAPGQNARVTFAGDAGSRISLGISGVTITSSMVSILNPDGTTLVAPTPVGTGGGFIDAKTLVATGTHTIVVDPQTTATGSMTLTLYDVPADASATASPGGGPVTVTTATPGQNARVSFDGAAEQRVSVQFTGVTIGTSVCCSTKVSMLKPDGTTLVTPLNIGTSGGFIDARTLPVAGTYTILLDPQSSATGSATVTVNDVSTAPVPIVAGGPPVTVTTTAAGENARLTFDGTAGARVSLAMTGVTISNSTVSIVKPDGSTLASMTNVFTAGGFVDATTLPVDGAYSILVDPQGTATGKMTLTLYDVPSDAGGGIVPGGSAVTATTTIPGQNAKLTFAGTEGQRVFLKLSNVTIGPSSCCSTKVTILKPDGSAVAAATSVGTSGGFVDTKSLPIDGTYTVFVDPQGTATGSVTLTLYDVPPDPSTTATPGGAPVSVTTTTPGQNATVTFDGVAGRQVSLKVGWTPSLCCIMKVSILRPDGGTILAPFSVGATGALIDAKPLPVSGTYSILVDPQSAAAGTATLTLYDVPPDVTAPITPGGPAVTLTTTQVGQNARFTFTASAGVGAFVTVGPNCCGTSVSILKPDGVAVAPAVPFAAGGGTLTARLPVAGTYTIFVDIQGQLTGSVTVRLALDGTPPPPPVVTITESAPDGHANGATFYYRPGGAGGTFSVNAAATDPGTGVQNVTFPALSGGFTPTLQTSDTTSPYSQLYTWSTSATFSGAANPVTVYDNVGNSASAPFAVIPDSVPPATTDNTASIGSAWKNTTQTVTLSPTDGSSGVGTTYYTTNGSTPTTSSAQGTLVTLATDGVYTLQYLSVDNVGNSEPVVTAGTQIRIDKTSPTTATTFPASGGRYNASGWNSGCGSSGACGTASDALSGVQKVEVSLRQGSGNYWDGSAFASATEVFLPAAGTTSWSLAFTAANFPADGSYTLRVRAVDNAGNAETPASRTFTYDTAPPETTITAAPVSPSNSASASFSFTASETGSTFQCSLDGAAFAACTSPKSYTGLAAGSHSFQVRATDAAGNTDVTPAAHSWTIDLTPPDTTIGSAPSTPTKQTSASFTFSSNETGTTFQCSLDSGAFAACTSPTSYTGLAGGSHTFRVRAVDAAGNIDATPASYTWTVDLTAPQTMISTAPAAATNVTNASFTFSSSEGGSTFECSLDGSAFAPCTSPQSYSGLAEGTHTFQVRATDPAGNTDATPAAHSWTVDLTVPETTLTSGPSSLSNSSSASFSFSSSESGSFQCSLDAAAFAACTSPKSYTGLSAGSHSFRVRAVDAAGNSDASPATWSWSIDLTAPETTISSGPPSATNSTSASFSFSSSEAGSSFDCALDGAAFAPCTSPHALSGLGAGAHTFQVRATDQSGNADATSASWSWTVDLTAPETTITSAPADPTNAADASFSFASNEAGGSFECSLDGAPFAACTSPRSYTGLAAGGHSFQVRATDAAGNTDASPAAHSWTTDLTPPDTTIGSGPATPTTQTSASFTFSANEAGSTFQCSLDAAAFATCTSPQSYTGLAGGSHTVRVRAVDPAGSPDPTPASYSWTVDLTAPQTTISSGPASATNVTSASFGFSSSEGGSSFECSLDGAAWAACTSPQPHSGLAEGAHTFEVRATDQAGNTDPTPAAHSWTIDLTAPETTITSAPADPTNATDASFSFSSDEAGATFECSLDGAAFTSCTSPRAYSGLTEGTHTFEVKATDPAGNADPSGATFGWLIDLTAPAAPTITEPANDGTTAVAAVTLSGWAEPGTAIEVFDGPGSVGAATADFFGNWTTTLADLADGVHNYTARATDAAGNTSSASNVRTLTVDTAAPETTIASGPANPTAQTDASFSFGSSEGGSSFECSLDGAPFAACTSPESYSGLAEGTHTFQVRATDAAGNTDASPASRSWTVDLTPPDTTILSGPTDPTAETTASFVFAASEGGSTFECSLDGAPFAACTSPQDYAGLAPGSHLFEVRATDGSGNTDASPATYGWTVV